MDGASTTSSAAAAVCADNFLLLWELLIVTNMMFEKYGVSTLCDFSETMHHQFGARVATFVAYRDCEGEVAVML
jgi:hypothetical protein